MSIKGNDRFQRKLEDRAYMKSGFKILAVDDDLSILELVKTALETLENYEVSVASNANDAMMCLQAADKPFDCFLLDIQMPDVDGIELLKQLRRVPEYSDTPILMLTAMSDRKYIDSAFLEGATDYVNKPFDFLELRSRIKCAHSLVKARRETEKSLQCASELENKLCTHQQFSLEDPLTIEGTERVLRYVEFDNYVAQLARRKLFGSQAVSVKLQDASLFYDLAGCEDFRAAVQSVAACIGSAIESIDAVFSYRGSGVFLVVLHERVARDSFGELIRAHMNSHVSDDRVEVLVGEAVPLRVLSRSNTSRALQRAVDAVQLLEDDLRMNDYPKSFDVAGDDPRPPEGDKRVYERVLVEIFGEESYLNFR